MDNLLCDESWLSGPSTPEPLPNFRLNIRDDHVETSPTMDAATVEEAISMDLEKELRFSNHGDKFIEFLISKKLTDARFQTLQWLVEEWSKWMVELVAVTSLSIASKFNEVSSPSLEDFQIDGLNHMFHHKTVLEMELIVLKALEWRVNSVTSFSFSQILVTKIGMGGGDIMMNGITDHLLNDLCDLKMLAYAPSVVAVAAVLNVFEEKAALEENLGKIMNLFGQEHKENITKCVHVMKSRNAHENGWRREVGEVKSPASVLQRGDVMNMNIVYYVGDLSAIFQILRSKGTDKKRKRDDNHEDVNRPAKKMTFVTSN
ncbi:putative cyclin-D7-1 [Hirschfeldia incana]|nr:putative cyclin-D7-1 [Hirschfeldia incana]